ncbi:MAG: hypothetical protein KDA65_02570 [Planctomycetaceae bacterium]|nr:hypothetical protein [Planctomycetaceae bacterium]
MRNQIVRSLGIGAMVFFWTPLLHAGMPSVSLTEYGQHRVSTYSFFIVGFLISAWIIKTVWNSLQADFVKLPRLTYKSSLLITTIWGLLFVLVLTMISGARELMTPQAWERSGALYKIKEPTVEQITPEQEQSTREARRLKLERLQGQLWIYALQHGGQFPSTIEESGLAEEYWTVPEQFQIRYLYRPDLQADISSAFVPLVIEPDIVGTTRYVLFTDGSIAPLSSEQISALLPTLEAEANDE